MPTKMKVILKPNFVAKDPPIVAVIPDAKEIKLTLIPHFVVSFSILIFFVKIDI